MGLSLRTRGRRRNARAILSPSRCRCPRPLSRRGVRPVTVVIAFRVPVRVVSQSLAAARARQVRSSSFFYRNMESRARETNEQIPLFLPLRPGGPAARTSPSPTSKVSLFIPRPLGITSRRPCLRVRPRRHATQRARSEIFKLPLAAWILGSTLAGRRTRRVR